jgi:hypothetical protein
MLLAKALAANQQNYIEEFVPVIFNLLYYILAFLLHLSDLIQTFTCRM